MKKQEIDHLLVKMLDYHREVSDLNFTVSLSMPEDKQFGAFDPVRQEWTGVIGMLANNNSSPGVG